MDLACVSDWYNELLLLMLLSYADARSYYIQLPCAPTFELSSVTIALCGFMLQPEDRQHPMRAPMAVVINSKLMYNGVTKQIRRVIDLQQSKFHAPDPPHKTIQRRMCVQRRMCDQKPDSHLEWAKV